METWQGTDESALAWLTEVSVESSVAGYDMGDMPESILVLHPMYERIDRQPLPWAPVSPDGDDAPGWVGPLTAEWRRLTWYEYTQRRGIQLVVARQWPFEFGNDGVIDDPGVLSPTEGSLDDTAVWREVTKILTAHSPQGVDIMCTAYCCYFLAYAGMDQEDWPHIYRGRLGDADDLIAPEHLNHNSPQNLWPDDRSWVLYTDYDAWATKISGSSDLVHALAAHPGIETLRQPK